MQPTRRQLGTLLLGGATASLLGSRRAAGRSTVQPPHATAADHVPSVDSANRTRVAVLLYEMAVLFDYAPAAEIFRVAEMGSAFEVYSVGADPDPISAMFPRRLDADFALADAPKPHVVVVPGGNWMAMRERRDVAGWLEGVLAAGGIVLSVCSGGYLLAQWGLLDGLPVAGLRAQLDLLRSLAPSARIVAQAPFIDAGQIVTAGGAATSLDAALHLVRRLRHEAAARWIAEVYLDHDAWNPSYDGRPPSDD